MKTQYTLLIEQWLSHTYLIADDATILHDLYKNIALLHIYECQRIIVDGRSNN